MAHFSLNLPLRFFFFFFNCKLSGEASRLFCILSLFWLGLDMGNNGLLLASLLPGPHALL